VVCHAVADALLGAAGLGDLGDHFPPGAPHTAGLPGATLLSRTAALVGAAGWAIGNVDVTVVCQAPAIAPHRQAMRCALAEALGVSDRQISIKATTPEGLGALGRGAGILAQAVALLTGAPQDPDPSLPDD
jgi:2-C-methyl-D-erythritol 2,4-cyclodiphosphate synthase